MTLSENISGHVYKQYDYKNPSFNNTIFDFTINGNEKIYIDLEQDHILQHAYQQMLECVSKAPRADTIMLLHTVASYANFLYSHKLNSSLEAPNIRSLGSYIERQDARCLQKSLTVGLFLEQLIHQGILPGYVRLRVVFIKELMQGHAWIEYEDEEKDKWVIDPSFSLVLTISEASLLFENKQSPINFSLPITSSVQ
jgi:hypothetical protein